MTIIAVALRPSILCGLRRAGLILVSTILLGIMATAWADTYMPDDDQTDLNNDIAHAVDLGVVGVAQDGSIIVAHRSGELGVVRLGGGLPDGFDSADVYKFHLNDSAFDIHIYSKETPEFTSYVAVYDATSVMIYESINNNNENFHLTLNPGTYYVAVLTSADVAHGRTLGYDLSITPTLIALPKIGGPSCAVATNLGRMASNGDPATGQPVQLAGSLSLQNPTSAFQFYTPNQGYFFVSQFILDPNIVTTLYDRVDGRSLPLKPMVAGSQNPTQVLLDPGYYCLTVHYAPDMNMGVKNYRIQLNGAFDFNPNPQKGGTLPLADVGDLSQNGLYPSTGRYVLSRYDGSEERYLLKMDHIYTVRDWVEVAFGDVRYAFRLDRSALISMSVNNLLSPISVNISDDAGKPVASAVTTGSSLTDLLPPMKLTATLPAGDYTIHLRSVGSTSIGTGFLLELQASAEAPAPTATP